MLKSKFAGFASLREIISREAATAAKKYFQHHDDRRMPNFVVKQKSMASSAACENVPTRRTLRAIRLSTETMQVEYHRQPLSE